MAETRSMTIRRRARLITSFFLRLLLLHLSLTSLEGADPSTTDMLEWERKQEINEAAQKKTAVFPCLFFFSLPAPLSLSRAPPLSLERNESRLFFSPSFSSCSPSLPLSHLLSINSSFWRLHSIAAPPLTRLSSSSRDPSSPPRDNAGCSLWRPAGATRGLRALAVGAG
jgi:hypothetical protein